MRALCSATIIGEEAFGRSSYIPAVVCPGSKPSCGLVVCAMCAFQRTLQIQFNELACFSNVAPPESAVGSRASTAFKSSAAR